MNQVCEIRNEIHISASSIRTLTECPREFYYHYIAGLPRESTPDSMILGSAIHEALSIFYLTLKQEGTGAKPEVMKDIAASYISDSESSDKDALITEAGRLLDVFGRQGYKPSGEDILAVERKFEIPVYERETGEYLMDFTGYMDLVVRDENGDVFIIDHKVVSRNDKSRLTSPDLQMALYSYAWREMYGSETVRLGYQYILKTKEPKVLLHDIQRGSCAKEESEAFETVLNAGRFISLMSEQPDVKNLMLKHPSWRCNGCGYRNVCLK